MKRMNARSVLSGGPGSGLDEGRIGERDEAVVLAVRGGQVAAAVEAGTADEQALGAAAAIRGVLRLESEQVLTFQIRRGASGAGFASEPVRIEPARARPRAEEPGGGRGGRFSSSPRTAEEIMTRDVLTTSPDWLVEDVAKQLAFHNVSGMPVEDWDGKVIGIVSEIDVIGKIGDTIRDVMSDEVISVSRTTPIEEVAQLLVARRIKRVPVLAEEMLVGIISRADLVRALAAQT